MVMKKLGWVLVSTAVLTGCSSTGRAPSEGEVASTGAGAIAGLVLGNAISDNNLVKAGVGALGGFVGNHIYRDLNGEFEDEAHVNVDRMQTPQGEDVIRFESPIRFGVDSAQMRLQDQQRIDRFSEIVKGQIQSITVYGHTDSDGTSAHNQRLSERRAQSVRYRFMQNGISAPIYAIGKGEHEPKYPNTSADHKRLNRRVEIIIQPKENARP